MNSETAHVVELPQAAVYEQEFVVRCRYPVYFTADTFAIENAVFATRDSISQGNTISEPLKKSGVFPPMVTQMISVGEQTGALDEMLEKIANFYDDEVDTAVDSLTAIIEPVMIVIMGVVVGGMLIAMYLPMFKLISVVSGG